PQEERPLPSHKTPNTPAHTHPPTPTTALSITAITQVQQVNRSLDCDLEMETEQLINDLLHGPGLGMLKAQ
ncbi:hypothetical protein ABZT06_48920, partial [Streptomyces sp. NPDC005483]